MRYHRLSVAILVLGILSTSTALAQAPALTAEQQAFLARANRHEKNGWIYLHIEGAPRARGFQHGYLLAREIQIGLKATRVDWENYTAMGWDWMIKKAVPLLKVKLDRENLAELDGIVEGLRAAGVSSSLAEIIAYNANFEITGNWWPQELKKIKENARPVGKEACSAFIATGHMTADGGIVLGHNTMQLYWTALPNVILDIVPEKGHRILMQAYAGWIHSGTDFFVTDAGLVGTETTLGGMEGFEPKGVPEFVRMRRATQDAGSIDEWCAIMKKGNNGGYANAWLLGDIKTGEIARLELGMKYVGFERTRDGFFTGSNVPENPKILRLETNVNETNIRYSGAARRLRWKLLMAENAGKIDLSRAKLFEADHQDVFLKREEPGVRSLCGHNDLQRAPGWPSAAAYLPVGTVDGKVIDTRMARQMSFSARWGSSCGTAFDAAKFLAEHPQFDWTRDILLSRPSQPWTDFRAGEEQ